MHVNRNDLINPVLPSFKILSWRYCKQVKQGLVFVPHCGEHETMLYMYFTVNCQNWLYVFHKEDCVHRYIYTLYSRMIKESGTLIKLELFTTTFNLCSGPQVAVVKSANRVFKCVTMKPNQESTIGYTHSTLIILNPKKCLSKSCTISQSAASFPYARNHISLFTTMGPTDLAPKNKLTVQIINTSKGLIGGVPNTPPDLNVQVQMKDFILVFETLEHVDLSVELDCTTRCVQVKLMV